MKWTDGREVRRSKGQRVAGKSAKGREGREGGSGPDSIPPPGASWFVNTKKLQVECSAGGSGGSWLAAQGNRPITPFCLVMPTCQRGTSELEGQQETFLYRAAPAHFSALLSFFPRLCSLVNTQAGKHNLQTPPPLLPWEKPGRRRGEAIS